VTLKASAIEKMVLFGDSLMAGYGLPNEYHLSVILEQNLKSEGHNIKVINGSVSGSTSSGGLNRVEWTLSESDIDLMILSLGANDMLRGINPDETQNNLEQIITIAQKKNIKVILAGMMAPTSHGFNYKKDFDKIYPDLSKKYNLPVANAFHAGDGNLHPLIMYDANEKNALEKTEKFGADILKYCVKVGGVLTGEHGVGVEKRELMCEMFNNNDIQQQIKIKKGLDVSSLLNPGKVYPILRKCAEEGRVHVHRGKTKFPDIPRF